MPNKENIIAAIRGARQEDELRPIISDSILQVRSDSPETAVSLYIINMIVILQGLKAQELSSAEFTNITTAIRIFREYREQLNSDPLDSLVV